MDAKQIKDYLLKFNTPRRIVQFLVSESGSHDYTINRREARDQLGLKIEKPDDTLYSKIKKYGLQK